MGRDSLYTRYWIQPGLACYHTDELTVDDRRVLYVEYLIKRSVEVGGSNGKRKKIVVGVKCHWSGRDEHGNLVQFNGRFGVNEIVPREIVDKGNHELMIWSEKVNM